MEGLIEIENPNRVSNKSKKAADIDLEAASVLSRRERWVTRQQGAVARLFWISNSKSIEAYLEGRSVDVCNPVRSIREEIEKQKSKDLLRKLQSEGRTEKGRADLARLAIVKKQREEAAKKREALRKGETPTTPAQM